MTDAWSRGGPLDRTQATQTGLGVAGAAASALASVLDDLEHADAAEALNIAQGIHALLARVKALAPRMVEPTEAFRDRQVAAVQKARRDELAQEHADNLRLFAETIIINKKES